MIEIKYTGEALWARIERAVEIVKQRLRRVVGALNETRIPYAVVGGAAVQHWVAQVDESVVRNTRDVDIILNQGDLPAAIVALEKVGFLYRHSSGVSRFLDGPEAKARDAVHVVFAGEKVPARVSWARSIHRGLRRDPRRSDAAAGTVGPDETDLLSTKGPSSPAGLDRDWPRGRRLAGSTIAGAASATARVAG